MFVEEKTQGEVVRELDDAAKILLKAADLIEQRGHCKNAYQSMDGRLCALGAIRVASGFDANSLSCYSVVNTPAMRVALAVDDSVHFWNDEPERTAAEVVATLRSVALS